MRQRIGVLAYLIVTALAYTAGPALGGSTTASAGVSISWEWTSATVTNERNSNEMDW